MTSPGKVAVAMSGGVDSSIAAALLVEQGYDVFGIMMCLVNNSCDSAPLYCSPLDEKIARNVSKQLEIPFYLLDARLQFKHDVIDFFLEGYAKGVTPNPCIECNRYIRWGYLLDHVRSMGATHLATGHYARLLYRDGINNLLRAVDEGKDQSYMLCMLNQEQLRNTIFPLGEYKKFQVRSYASHLDFPVSDRSDSQDLCFVGSSDYRTFLRAQSRVLPPPGPIVDQNGHILGQHQGLANYTIGQRKGIRVSSSHPLYVLKKDLDTNSLIVGPHAALATKLFYAGQVNWISNRPPQGHFRANIQIRYNSPEFSALIYILPDERVRIELDEPAYNVTPGQFAAFYTNEACLGGGMILG